MRRLDRPAAMPMLAFRGACVHMRWIRAGSLDASLQPLGVAGLLSRRHGKTAQPDFASASSAVRSPGVAGAAHVGWCSAGAAA